MENDPFSIFAMSVGGAILYIGVMQGLLDADTWDLCATQILSAGAPHLKCYSPRVLCCGPPMPILSKALLFLYHRISICWFQTHKRLMKVGGHVALLGY